MKQQRLGFQKLYQNLDKILFLFFYYFYADRICLVAF